MRVWVCWWNWKTLQCVGPQSWEIFHLAQFPRSIVHQLQTEFYALIHHRDRQWVNMRAQIARLNLNTLNFTLICPKTQIKSQQITFFVFFVSKCPKNEFYRISNKKSYLFKISMVQFEHQWSAQHCELLNKRRFSTKTQFICQNILQHWRKSHSEVLNLSENFALLRLAFTTLDSLYQVNELSNYPNSIVDHQDSVFDSVIFAFQSFLLTDWRTLLLLVSTQTVYKKS